MAKDDMDVIMYKILKYMYACMKVGKKPALEDMCYKCKLFQIPEQYWNSIMVELIEAGFVRGFVHRATKDGILISMMNNAAVTMTGVHFLEDNNKMKQARDFLGVAFEIAIDTVVGAII